MAIFDRIVGTEDPRIPVHTLSAVLQEYGFGHMTAAQAKACLGPISSSEASELQLLLDAVVNGSPGMEITGTTTQARLARAQLVHHVLLLVEAVADPYTTPAAVRARLGI